MPNIKFENSQYLEPKKDYDIDDSLRNLYKERDNLIIFKKELETLPFSFGRDEEIKEGEKEIKILISYIESLQKFKDKNKYKLGKLE